MKIGKVPTSDMSSVVRYNISQYTLKRPTFTKNRINEEEKTFNDVSVEIWLFQESRAPEQLVSGERINSTLQGYSLPSEDIQKDDILSHSEDFFEIQTTNPIQHKQNTIYTLIDFKKMQNIPDQLQN